MIADASVVARVSAPLLESLLISFADHNAVALSIRNYREFATFDAAQLKALTLGLGGTSPRLETRDLRASIAGLVLVSQPLMDMVVTLNATRNSKRRSATKTRQRGPMGEKAAGPN